MLPLDTKRLTGRPPLASDLHLIRVIHSDSRVMATLAADGQPADAVHSATTLARMCEHWERHGFGVWMLFEKDGGRFAGYAGIRHIELDGAAEVELLYTIRSDRWGAGYATEAAREALRLGFLSPSPASIVGFTLPHNYRSRAVLEKCGMHFERDIVHAALPHVLYRIAAAQFAGIRHSAAT